MWKKHPVPNHLPLHRLDGADGKARGDVLEVLPVRDLLRVLRAGGLHQALQLVYEIFVRPVLRQEQK